MSNNNYSKNIININPEIYTINNFLTNEECDHIINISKNQYNMVNKKTIISDIVYRPQNTIFLNNFHKNNKIYGISMLINQAIHCFEHWFGFRPKVYTALKNNLFDIIK